MRIDPIRLEVIRHGLSAIADEMGLALQRAAYSTNIKTRLDFSCALFDRSLRSVAQSFSQPNHLGSLAHFVPRIVEEHGAARLRPGDVLICNDGHRGGVHLNDVCVVSPIFHDGVIVAYAATLAHHIDVGGGTPGSLAGLSREVYGEGLRIPPLLLVEAGRPNETLARLISNNFRAPRESNGDLRAQLAGLNVGARRLTETIERHGWETIEAAIDELLDYTERRVREELRALPAGTYEATGYMDDDGLTDEPIVIKVRITIEDGGVTFDLSGSDPQRPCPINATYAMVLSNCAYPIRALLSPDLPVNDGFYRALKVFAPEGSIVNCRPPAAIGGGWETAFRVMETSFQALAQVVSERLAAGSKGCLCNIAVGGPSRDGGEQYVFYDSMGGGFGGRARKDGIDGVQPFVQNTENAPIEETEANYPIRFLRYALIPDSEGAGTFRGGLGLRRDYQVETPTAFSVLADRAKFPPWGLAGGGSARPAHYILDPDGEARELPSKFTVYLEPGGALSVQMGGGGGYGSPLERDPQAVLADVLAGKVSVDRALNVYGVMVADNVVDHKATAARRAELHEVTS